MSIKHPSSFYTESWDWSRLKHAAKQAGSGRKHSAALVQDVFLHTIYKSLSHRCKDIHSEMKPLLADSGVIDDAYTCYEDHKWQKREAAPVGPTNQSKKSIASSAQVSDEPDRESCKRGCYKKGQDDAIKQLTTRIDTFTSMVDAIQGSMPVQSEGGYQMFHQSANFLPCEPLAVLSAMHGRRLTGLYVLFHLWWGWTPGSWVPMMT